jgi:hypothetical protein
MHSPTSHIVHFSCLSISSFSNNVWQPVYDEMTLQYPNSPLAQLPIPATMQMFVCDVEGAIFSCRCNGMVSHLSREQRIFLVIFLQLPSLHFSVLSTKDSNIWRVWQRCETGQQMVLLLPTVLWHLRMRKYFKCYKQKWLYNAELLCEEVGNSFYSVHKNYKKKLTQYNFCPKMFKCYVTICDTMYFADRNKVNFIHLS